MDVMNFIKPELLILVPVLYTIGLGIKKSKVSDNYIPLILGIVSIFLSTLWVISTSDIKNWQDAVYAVFISLTQGILTAGASVYINQLYIQFQKTSKRLQLKGGGQIDLLKSALTVRTNG